MGLATGTGLLLAGVVPPSPAATECRACKVRRDAMPGEGFEPPTFGLQNRCTTAVLFRPSDTEIRCLFGTCPDRALVKRMIRLVF